MFWFSTSQKEESPLWLGQQPVDGTVGRSLRAARYVVPRQRPLREERRPDAARCVRHKRRAHPVCVAPVRRPDRRPVSEPRHLKQPA
ncbi:hypothetical protein MTO96_049828 [Rhipicephalus appendiculatus]